ncbi:hypothetical protein MKZ38_002244 [Zalerion maritima]|uniref:Uncharacterized protein n=1 Tax=Zalerion maritima TaxID=339359 RepID=A0AAD5RP85_9PEZI|nr:hypothetical protein MKZ38_002244 [Zalerion maritima]
MAIKFYTQEPSCTHLTPENRIFLILWLKAHANAAAVYGDLRSTCIKFQGQTNKLQDRCQAQGESISRITTENHLLRSINSEMRKLIHIQDTNLRARAPEPSASVATTAGSAWAIPPSPWLVNQAQRSLRNL